MFDACGLMLEQNHKSSKEDSFPDIGKSCKNVIYSENCSLKVYILCVITDSLQLIRSMRALLQLFDRFRKQIKSSDV